MNKNCPECSGCGYFSKDQTFPFRNYCNFYSGYVISTAEPCPYFDEKENIEYDEKMKDIYFEEEKAREIYDQTYDDNDYFYYNNPLTVPPPGIFF